MHFTLLCNKIHGKYFLYFKCVYLELYVHFKIFIIKILKIIDNYRYIKNYRYTYIYIIF